MDFCASASGILYNQVYLIYAEVVPREANVLNKAEMYRITLDKNLI